MPVEESRLHILGGISGGYSGVQTSVLTEADKNGFHLDGVILGSYRFSNPIWVDLGFGWFYNRMSGSAGVITEDRVITYSPFVDLAARYPWGDHWQFGLISKTAFGTELNFGGNDSKASFGILMGPQVIYQWTASSWLMRLSAQGLTDLNIPDRHIQLALVGFQIGLPTTSLTKRESSSPSTDEMVDIVELSNLGFQVGSARLSATDTKVLRKLAKVLNKYSTDWKVVFIGGHTDSRGSESFNQKLSSDRASAVKDVFVSEGIPSNRIKDEGFGFRQPKMSGNGETVWSRNRRVEVKVLGPLKAAITEKIRIEIAE